MIYDTANKTQQLLQGHANAISACCVSEDKRWIVTADVGPDPMLVVWDSHTGLAAKAIARPHLSGVQAMDLSADGARIVTLSREAGGGAPQEIAVWDWTAEGDGPAASAEVDGGDFQRCVRFSPDEPGVLISNGKRRVVFWALGADGLTCHSPPPSERDFAQPIGELTVSLFLPRTGGRAVSATADGDVVVWERAALAEPGGSDRRAVKIVRLHPRASLDFVAVLDEFIVTAGSDGHVRFFDFEFRVVAWFEDLDAGPIASVSFARAPAAGARYAKQTAAAGSLRCPDFVVGTLNALIIGCTASLFDELEESGRRGSLLVQGNDAPVHGLALHPSLPRFALCGHSGTLQLWDYDERKILLMRLFDRLLCSALAFDPKGRYLAAGFTNGSVRILHGMTLEEVAAFRPSKDVLTKVCFSHDLAYMAAAGLDRCVALFKWWHKEDDEAKPKEWTFLGRHGSHFAPIVDLAFGVDADGLPELASVGEDRALAIYDLERSSVTGGIALKSSAQVEQLGTPTACMWHRHGGARGLDRCVLVGTDSFKFRLYDPASEAVRSTLLAPAHGGPPRALALVPQPPGASDAAPRFIAYASADKVAGLIALPLDGTPHSTMGAIVHGGQISAMGVSWDGQWLVTAGGADLCIHMTQIQPAGLAPPADAVGAGAFLDLLEGGRDGPFAQEMADYFYYAQLRAQGEDSKLPRAITGAVPLSELPNLVRALGFYPSEAELDRLLVEAAHSAVHATGELTGTVGFDEFVRRTRAAWARQAWQPRGGGATRARPRGPARSRASTPAPLPRAPLPLPVYVNHRPVFGVGKEHIEEAFKMLSDALVGGGGGEAKGALSREQLLYALENLGARSRFGRARTRPPWRLGVGQAGSRRQPLAPHVKRAHAAPVPSAHAALCRAAGESLSREELLHCLKALTGKPDAVAALAEAGGAADFAQDVLGFEDERVEEGTAAS